MLNQHDTTSRGSATECKQQRSVRVCLFVWCAGPSQRSNYLSSILFSVFSFCDFSFITAYRIYGTFKCFKCMQNIRLNPILEAKHSYMDVKLWRHIVWFLLYFSFCFVSSFWWIFGFVWWCFCYCCWCYSLLVIE